MSLNQLIYEVKFEEAFNEATILISSLASSSGICLNGFYSLHTIQVQITLVTLRKDISYPSLSNCCKIFFSHVLLGSIMHRTSNSCHFPSSKSSFGCLETSQHPISPINFKELPFSITDPIPV